jgi:hypothetical protein
MSILYNTATPAPLPPVVTVVEGGGCDVVAALKEQLTAMRDTFSATVALNVNLQIDTSSNKDGPENGGDGADVSDCGQLEWGSDEDYVVGDTRGPHTTMTMAPEGDQLAGGADRVARSMVREQQRDDSPGKRRSEGRSSRLSSLNMKMCTLTPTPVE